MDDVEPGTYLHKRDMERLIRAELQAAFVRLRKSGAGLTLSQEQELLRCSEIR